MGYVLVYSVCGGPRRVSTYRPTINTAKYGLACKSPQGLQLIALNISQAERNNQPTRPFFELPCCGGSLPPGEVIGFVTPGGWSCGGTGSSFSLVGGPVIPRGWLEVNSFGRWRKRTGDCFQRMTKGAVTTGCNHRACYSTRTIEGESETLDGYEKHTEIARCSIRLVTNIRLHEFCHIRR